MLTQEQVIQAVSSGARTSETIDGRDFARLLAFFPKSQFGLFGYTPAEGRPEYATLEWTRENVLEQVRGDIAFGFEKALDQRGISSAMMFAVVKMWMWILEDPLEAQASDMYAQYGLPFFKAVALKYDMPNPIGDDTGSEDKYAAEGD